jgi:hypothetical protein
MIKPDKKLRDLSEILNGGNNRQIMRSIELLREEIPFDGAISLLTSFYDTCNDNQIRQSIALFLNDLKYQSVTAEVIAEIRKEWKPETISMLVSSCWQSRLDYSEYYIDLINTFLKGDYVTAIECLTVFEEVAHVLSKKKKNEIIKIIKDNPFGRGDEKSTLTGELLTIFAS